MATVTYRGRHPEPSVTFTDGPLEPWGPGRRPGAHNMVWAFPRNVPRPVPAVVAAWIAAVRRRHGPWFEVRFERGEWSRLLRDADALVPWPPVPDALCLILSKRARRRATRAWRRRERARRRRGGHAKVRHFLAWANLALVDAFVAGCRRPVTVGSAERAERTVDPLESR